MKTKSIVFLLFLMITSSIFGQKISIAYIYPAGGQKGTSFEIEVGGLNVSKATSVYVSGEGVKAEILETPQTQKKQLRKKLDDQSSPQMADRIKIRVTIDRNAITGLRDFRLQESKGVSNKLTFDVGQFPDIIEKGISSISKPNVVNELPATLCGQIMPGEQDYFSFKASKGTTFVAAVKARVFVPFIADAVPGWFQAKISIRNSKGREIAFDDDFRNNVDPVIICKLPEDDTYTLMIQDAIFRGREDFNYRIDIGEIPYIEYIYPVVGKEGKPLDVHLIGVNIDKKVIKFSPNFSGKGSFSVQGKGGYVSNSILFKSVEKSEKILYAPSSTSLVSNSLVYDSLSTASKSKKYTLELDKNEQVTIELTARRLGSLIDGELTLYDANGNKVAESDDVEDSKEGLITNHADPVLNYKATAAGKYNLVVSDVLRGFGKDFYYLIERKKTVSNFEVFVSPANISIPKGGTATFSVDVTTTEKKSPRLELDLKGLPKGFLLSSMEVRSNKWEVSITAPKNAKEQNLNLNLMANFKGFGKNAEVETQEALPADNMMQAFYYMHHIPAANFVAEITKEAPFSLHFSPEIERNLQTAIGISKNDSVFPVKIYLYRNEGFNETVSLQLSRKNQQITLDPVEFKPGETEKTIYIKFNLNATEKLKIFRRTLAVVGTVNGKVEKRGKRSFDNALYREMTPLLLLELK